MNTVFLTIQIILASISVSSVVVMLGIFLGKVSRNERDITRIDERYHQLGKELSNKIDKIDERYYQLSGELSNKIDKIDERYYQLSGVLSDKIDKRYDQLSREFSDKIDKIYDKLPSQMSHYVKSGSPVTLTDDGKRLSEELGVRETIERLYDTLEALVIKKEAETLNPYDIQQSSLKAAKNNLLIQLTEDEINNLKRHAFKEGVDIDDLIPVYGIVLRDLIFKERHIEL